MTARWISARKDGKQFGTNTIGSVLVREANIT
jgi:hypothetical protein